MAMSCTSAQGIAPFNASRVLPDQFGKTWVLPPGVRLKRGGFSYGEKKEIEALARSGDIRATIRGLVSQVPVTDGDDIVEGDLLIVLEAMKMLNYKLPVTRKRHHHHNGIYHPWSKTQNSIINYYTITSVEDHRARKIVKLEQYSISEGNCITNVVYASEGLCIVNLKDRQIEFRCSDVDENPQVFKRLGAADAEPFREQWLYLKCKEGYEAFILDSTLLKTK